MNVSSIIVSLALVLQGIHNLRNTQHWLPTVLEQFDALRQISIMRLSSSQIQTYIINARFFITRHCNPNNMAIKRAFARHCVCSSHLLDKKPHASPLYTDCFTSSWTAEILEFGTHRHLLIYDSRNSTERRLRLHSKNVV